MDFKKIKKNVLRLWPIVFVKRVSQKIIIPGFDGLSLNEVSIFFYKGLSKGSITTQAAALSFTFFLAIFPAIIFFFTLIPYIPIDNFQDILLNSLEGVMPKEIHDKTINTLTDIVKRQNGGLLSFGFLAALYFSTNGTTGIMNAFNVFAHVKESRSFIKQKATSISLVLIFSTLIIIAIALIFMGSNVILFLQKKGIFQNSFVYFALVTSKWVVSLAFIFFSVSLLYYLAPAKNIRFRFISAGSMLATILFIITSLGFNYYISSFSQYNKLYGSIGALIILLTWIYFNAMVLLIGFALNISIINAKENKRAPVF